MRIPLRGAVDICLMPSKAYRNGKDPPPLPVDEERLVLGAILTEDPDMSIVWEILSISDFGLQAHGTIYRRMRQIRDRGEPVDRITVARELADHKELDAIGGLSYLCSLD